MFGITEIQEITKILFNFEYLLSILKINLFSSCSCFLCKKYKNTPTTTTVQNETNNLIKKHGYCFREFD